LPADVFLSSRLAEKLSENSICARAVCRYVGRMTLPQLLLLGAVLGVAVIFVWRSSGAKKSDGGCECCGCAHEDGSKHGSSPAKK
jgi:hypothetical protein